MVSCADLHLWLTPLTSPGRSLPPVLPDPRPAHPQPREPRAGPHHNTEGGSMHSRATIVLRVTIQLPPPRPCPPIACPHPRSKPHPLCPACTPFALPEWHLQAGMGVQTAPCSSGAHLPTPTSPADTASIQCQYGPSTSPSQWVHCLSSPGGRDTCRPALRRCPQAPAQSSGPA